MSLAVLIDMNLPRSWAPYLTGHGYPAVHWSAVGPAAAPDPILMAWALVRGHIILTRDLGFGALLALTHASGPSVVQIRDDDVIPSAIGARVVAALRQCETDLLAGALVVVDAAGLRLRILPI